ncbi:MAG: polysaccharide deacetylase family protein [Nocardioidaceae bacterium]
MSRRGAAAALAAGGCVAGAAYWRHMSPWSEALGPFPRRGPAVGDRPQVALTFDDGPNEPYTSQIADVLAEARAAATFFQVGRCVQRHPGLTAELAAAGHTIGNHSLTHTFTRGWTRAAVAAEVDAAEDLVAAELGRRPLLYRPPWLIRTRAVLDVLDARGLRPLGGEFCHPLEPMQPSARAIARRALALARPGSILIFHDGWDDRGGRRDRTAAAVAEVVDTLGERGVELVTVDRLLGVPAYGDPSGRAA